jgi:hypothetical protein
MRHSRLIRPYAAWLTAVALAAGLQTFDAAAAATTALTDRSSTEQMVTITVSPPHALAGASWAFEVALTTHVQPLDDDLMKTAALVDAQGKRHAPVAWRGDGPGGHHRKGVLVFTPIQPRPASLELQIQRAGEKAPRSFKWQMP